MKASPSQIFKEAETLKASLSGESLGNYSEVWEKRQELCHLYETLLLIDLDYALDKKVEQDLWSFIFRNPISACQSKAREHKKSNHNYTTLLETASGFYLQLLQKLCCAYDIDLPCHPRDSVYGLTKEWISSYPVAHQPRKSSLLYICQHCLVHLGDIARYRGQSLQAENFYRHAVDLVPSNGQPYNQLALLEAASGEKLSTVFFYVRSLSVKHPFPNAATNLQNLFSKMSSDGNTLEGKSRMSAFEYVSVFLQLHAVVHLNQDLKRTDPMLTKLTTSFPALIIAEKFETWQLVQMVAVCLFAIEHAWGSMDGGDKNSFEKTMLSPEELKASSLIEDLLVSMLHAFLLPVHASLEPKETVSYYTLPAVKIILDWLLQDPQLLQHEALNKNPQVWHGLCKLLNDLDVASSEPLDTEKFEDIPLPEDWDLQSFLPLKKSQSRLKFNLSAATPSDEESMLLRSIRLCKLGESLTEVKKEGLNPLSLIHVGGQRVFKAVCQTEALSEQVLQQIQELTINPSPSTCDNSSLINGSVPASDISLRPTKLTHGGESAGPQVQEVRFKLDDMQQRKEKTDEGERRKEGRRRNVAMQAILQQRAAQSTSNIHPRNQDIKEVNTMHPELRQNPRTSNPVENNNRNQEVLKDATRATLHHVSQEHFNQFQQQALNTGGNSNTAVASIQQCERNEPWLQQFSTHQSGMPRDANNYLQRVVQTPSAPAHFGFQQQPPPPPSQQPKAFIAANPPSVLWNYMGFVAPYQQAPNPPPIIVPQQNAHPQAPQQTSRQGFFLMNGTQQDMEAAASNLLHAYRNSTSLQQPDIMRDTSHARVWQQDTRADNHVAMNQVVGRPVSQNNLPAQPMQGGSSTLPHDLGSNTYSLFNSPWPSGLTMARPNKEGGHNSIDPVFMQSRIQSLWSGPGPSPLERLLEQQKQRRDGTTQ